MKIAGKLPRYTSFDTTETYLYKLAQYWNIPYEFVVPNQIITNEPSYTNIFDFVASALNQGLSLNSIEKYLGRIRKGQWKQQVIEIRVVLMVQSLDTDTITGEEIITPMKKVVGIYAKPILAALQQINDYKDYLGEKHLNISNIRTIYGSYKDRIKTSIEDTKQIVAAIRATHKQYADAMAQDTFETSELIIVTENLQYIVNAAISKGDTLSVFDSITLSAQIPHMICLDNTGIYSKLYAPDPFEPQVREKDLVNIQTVTALYSITFSVVLKNTYFVVYNVDEGILKVDVKTIDKDDLTAAILILLPHLDISLEIAELSCQLRFYPRSEAEFTLQEHYLLHRIVVQPQLFQFYTDESTSAYPRKNQLRFRYRPAWIIGTGIENESIFTLSASKTLKDTSYININITANGMVSIYRLLASLVPAICIYYQTDLAAKSPLRQLYKIPNINPKNRSAKPSIKKQLRDQWPDIFTAAYVKAVGVKDLVQTTTKKEEAERWKDDIIQKKDQEYERMVLPFPPGADEEHALFYFTSVSVDSPYIGYNPNTYDDEPLYPVVPASFAAPRSDERDREETDSKAITSSLMALTAARFGVVSDSIEAILGMEIQRFGVSKGPNSFISAILVALGKSDDDIIDVRLALSKLYPELYQQQLYDLTRQQIKHRLRDVESYFDPALYIAGLEHMFNIDIYVIVPTTKLNITTNQLEVPRHNHLYARSGHIRKCVIIFKNKGIKSDRLLYPHCELLIPKDNPDGSLFSKKVSARLRDVFDDCFRCTTRLSLQSSDASLKGLSTGDIYKCQSTRSRMDLVLGKYQTVSQYIDGKGKARAFTVQIGDKELVTLFCYPTAPGNYPHSDIVSETTFEILVEICGTDEILQQSSLGIWMLHAGSNEILYARLRDIENINEINVSIVDDPLIEDNRERMLSTVDFVQEVSYRDKLVLVLNELIKWMYVVYSIDTDTVDYITFLHKYMTHLAEPADDIGYYDISTIKEKFPAVKNVAGCMDILRKVFPYKKRRIVLHSEAFYQSIEYILNIYSRSMKLGRKVKHAHRMPGYYRSIYDFIPRNKTVIFIGTADTRKSVTDPNVLYTILDTMLEEYNIREDPLIYSDGLAVEGKVPILYLIQNTRLGDYKSAIAVCISWKNQINSGYRTEPSDVIIKTLVYRIMNGGLNPVAVINDISGEESEGEDDFVEVVLFENGKYAALMRL
jgi:hypothetical protein